MDAIKDDPEVISTEFLSHLSSLRDDPVSVSFDDELCQRTIRALTISTSKPLLLQLLAKGESMLPILSQTSQDLDPLTALLRHIITLLPVDILSPLLPAEKLIMGLNSDVVPIQILCIAHIMKLATTASGAAFVASSPELSDTLVALWLKTKWTKVAERCIEALLALLDIDRPSASFPMSSPTPALPAAALSWHQQRDLEGMQSVTVPSGLFVQLSPSVPMNGPETHQIPLFWRRLFLTSTTYSLLFSFTTHDINLSTYSPKPPTISNKKFAELVTNAQARLLDFLMRLGYIHFMSLSSSFIPDVEARYTPAASDVQSRGEAYSGLLLYLTRLLRSNPDADPLMAALLRDFFVNLAAMVDLDNEEGDARRSGLPANLIRAIRSDAGLTGSNDVNGTGMHL